jgi:UDP-N-acetylmuramyl pentapeptide phosphotransferase/UDP-N-acetylglucosamine-1-phosphate transferase/nucleoside-diphosphate-sugar epimerase
MIALAVTAGVVLVVGLVAPLILLPVLRRGGVVDRASARSLHAGEATRGVGLASALAIVLGFAILMATASAWRTSGLMMVAVVLCAILGFIEDGRGLRVRTRLAGQALIGAFCGAVIVAWWGAPWFAVPVLAVVAVILVNATNFMDGVDGISGLHGVAVGLAVGVGGWLVGAPGLVGAGVVVAAGFASFLPWNLGRKGTFLGDAGSYVLGGATTGLLALGVMAGLPLVAVVGPVVIYLADTGHTLLMRAARAEPLGESHRDHVFQRLVARGWPHIRAAVFVTGATVLTSLAGLASIALIPWGAALAAELAVAAAYIAVGRSLSRSRADVSGELTSAPMSLPLSPRRGISRWAVIGASGFIGSAVVAALEARGFEVVGITAPRLEFDPDSSAAEVAASARGLPETDALAAGLAGIDVVVNAAGAATPDGAMSPQLFGANALLPVVISIAADRAGAARMLHLSSAAVQGRRSLVDETLATAPFSAYSRSKASGEAALLVSTAPSRDVIVRATSVQGRGRRTTEQLRALARSPLASVAGRGELPTVVSSVDGLADFIVHVGTFPGRVPSIVLQPWEGLTTGETLRAAGGREPRHLPVWFCRFAVSSGFIAAAALPPLAGLVRRVELMWFGQRQDAAWAASVGIPATSRVLAILADGQAAS